jgi:microcystin-dependent protein
MSCTDCYNNCDPAPTADSCVKYTGEAVAELDISFGDNLKCVQKALIDYLLAFKDASGITLTELASNCEFLDNLILEDYSLKNILQAYSTALCSLDTRILALQPAATSFDVTCLEGLTVSSTPNQILQATINKLCSVTGRVAAIEASYVTKETVTSMITQQTTTNSSTQENTKLSRYVAYPYHGPLSVFDSTGAGISAQGYDKIYICNGQTIRGFKTPDYRGYSPIGANIGVPGGALDSAVDPAQVKNAGYGIGINAKKGSYTHTLTQTEGPAHNHTVTDPGHEHYILNNQSNGVKWPSSSDTVTWSSNKANGNQDYDMCKGLGAANIGKSSAKATGISLENAGGGQPHNNTHPVVGTVFIMYIP